MTRRRFLLAACAGGLASELSAQALRWQGTALGARAQIRMVHPEADRLTRHAVAEISRLERIFSLYGDSELTRLNRDGRLVAPSFELLDCLAVARRAHDVTGGLFDPTVQPLWLALAEGGDVNAARDGIGFDRVRFDTSEVRLERGQALTLNGIAQGYVADRIAALLRAEGVADVLVDTGEISARGKPQAQPGWPVRIARTERRLMLRDRALATSATLGTVLDAAGRQGHILHPTGAPVPDRQVSISATSAAMADALSTGLCLVTGEAEVRACLARVEGARLEAILNDPTET
ncbi:FAD:protein FMN transferase [Donghicola sp. B5-SW-15]|uniref:FAD:protein FMN transferase n=1 Tax=Donghicola mangrovi TaxID=2729614 RepID=A0A850Q8U8_9RHOB|nr:FAD:protein FMN transferase [Donghicola mangrovi]